MTYQELINICKTKKRLKNLNKEQKQQFLMELKTAERFYNNGRDIYQEFIDNKEKIQTQYVLPYILEFTEKITNEKIDMVQVSKGASGGIDVDVDFQGGGREFILEYLKEKYGEDCVINVGTQNTLGMKSAVKDILRFYKIPYEKSNEFSKALDRELTWEENLDSLKVSNYNLYKFYESKKEIFDLVPKFIDRPRQAGKHAGGICILPEPVYNYVPVERVQGVLVTGYQESGQKTDLDELGVIKFDILGISTLDVIKNAVEMIDEEIYLIEEDGIIKAVPESYLKKEEAV